jgi:hypothetical protein
MMAAAGGRRSVVILLIAWWIAATALVAFDLRARFAGEPRSLGTSLGIWGFAVALAAFSVFWFTGAHDL